MIMLLLHCALVFPMAQYRRLLCRALVLPYCAIRTVHVYVSNYFIIVACCNGEACLYGEVAAGHV